ncbi:hypothetical protein ACEQ8H_007471 [Pleosporales sp. CAS-2024a]
MHVRPATPQDEPSIAAICTAAFFEESLFGQVIHPHRHQYPSDPIIFWHHRIRKSYLDPRNRLIVATITEDASEKIVGMATWQRQGEDAGAQNIISSWPNPGPDAFAPLASTRNRAMDASKATILHDSYPWFQHHWDGVTNGLPRANNWHLNLCCIDPAYQKRGFGQQLLAWGLEQARSEKVHSSVVASFQNEGFYLRCGYEEVVGNCLEGEGNPLAAAGVKGGDILWKWATQRERDEEKAQEKASGMILA